MDPLAHLQSALSERYRVEKLIGVGGMAIVYLARDLRHDRNVALKLLNRNSARSSASSGS